MTVYNKACHVVEELDDTDRNDYVFFIDKIQGNSATKTETDQWQVEVH